jgi:hypothetical protein
MNDTQTMEVMDQLTLQRVIDDLQKAFDVCDGVDYDADIQDYQKQAPFAVGYSRSACWAAIHDLDRLLAKYK